MYILIKITFNGVRLNQGVAYTKKELVGYLKDKGYYFSKTYGRYINDKTIGAINSGSDEDFEIEKIDIIN